MNLNCYDTICEILTLDQKKEAKILFESLQPTQINTLINIWERSSSLLRWNNIKKELRHSYNENPNILNPTILNIIILGLQYYVDKKTHTTHTTHNKTHSLKYTNCRKN